MNKTLSIIISAYNEEENVQAALESAKEFLKGRIEDYELLVFNDGSSDQTGEIAKRLAKNDSRIRVIHNSPNKGLAYIAKEGFRIAQKNYITWFPGDNSIDGNSMIPFIDQIGRADIVVAYMANRQCRPLVRRILSVSFVMLINLLFGLKVKYYNGATVYPADFVKKVRIFSNGYDFFAELLVRSLKSGKTFKEVPFIHKYDPRAKSKAVSLRNFMSIVKTTGILIKDIYIRHKPCG